MKFSEAWLRELVEVDCTREELVARLTAAGLEVDSVEPVAEPIEGVVVARVRAVRPHPGADRLRLCEVEAGDGELLEVVCGAPNVRPGLCAPLARVGARLAGGRRIRRSRIRGVVSEGMLCSAVELGLGEEADGILELDPQAVPGTPLGEHLRLDDVTIDIDLTPNRGDCLGLEGVAREVALAHRGTLRPVAVAPVPAEIDDALAVRLAAAADCPRYVGRVIRDIDPQASTPLWLRERLRRSGLRSISPVVDVTNYVMTELGQPMHAFDLERLHEGIVVRRARSGEPLTLLDGTELTLDPEALVIADEQRAVALAGVMGGLDSAVTGETRHVLLESAWFLPRTIALGARRLGLHTDASHRFERNVSPELQARACERATALLLEICGGRPGPLVDAQAAAELPRPRPIRLRTERIGRLLGVALEAGEVEEVLERLGCAVERAEDGWQVLPPAFRADLAIEADLIEELARVHGYDALPARAPHAPLAMRGAPEARVGLAALRAALVGRGYREAISYSFVDPRLQALLDPEIEPLGLANPISSELAVMRTSLWPGLVAALRHNLNRQQGRVRLFETGLVFRRGADGIEQTARIGVLAAGDRLPEQWGAAREPVDFHDLRGDLEALYALTGEPGAFRIVPDRHPALHPGQSARVERDGRPIGRLGALHPRVAGELKIGVPVLLLELELAAIERGRVPAFAPLSRYPSVRRDIALVVDEQISAQAIADCVGQAGVDVLKNLEFFDVYRGEGIDSGKKSVAVCLTFQDPARTLNDEEVDAGVAAIVEAARAALGAELRG